MAAKIEKTKKKVSGGWVVRSANSGRFVEVITDKGKDRASPKSGTSVREASDRRSSALKRLADR